MTFLPIVARELRVTARKRSTYWLRTGAGLAIIVLGTWMFLMLQSEGRPPHELALPLFAVLTGSAVLYALLSGVLSTVDCLSAEKREGTLGLLFLTDLKGYDVVLGKLAANSLNALYAVLAVVPMLAIPLLMGGVAPGEFGRMGLVAVNTMFFSLALGMWASAMSRSGRKAAGLTLVLLLLITAGMPAYGAWLGYAGKGARWEKLCMLPSAGFSYAMAFASMYKLKAREFWESVALIHSLGWVCLALASVIAPRTWQDKPPGVQQLRWRGRWQAWSYGSQIERHAFRTRLLEANAFFWLAARARLKPALVWGTLGLIACGWAWGLAKFKREWLNEPTYFLTGLLLNGLLKIWFATEAGRQLAEDRTHGSLELLLSTPLTVQDILRGQWLALKRQFLGPLVIVLAAFFLFMLASDTDMSKDEHRMWVSLWAGGMVMLLADLTALYWVGMWHGLTAKSPNHAVAANWVSILVSPYLAYLLVVLMGALISLGSEFELGWEFFLGLLFALGLAADLWFGTRARVRILNQFRQAAALRYAGRPGWWKTWLGSQGNPSP